MPKPVDRLLLVTGLVVFGCPPHRFLYRPLMRGKIDGPVAARARNSVVRPKPAKDLFEAMAALRLAADQIEQPEIKEAHPRRRCPRHGVLPGNRS